MSFGNIPSQVMLELIQPFLVNPLVNNRLFFSLLCILAILTGGHDGTGLLTDPKTKKKLGADLERSQNEDRTTENWYPV